MWKTEYKQRRADNSPSKNTAIRRPRYVRAFFCKTRDSRLSYSSPVVASWHISTLCPPPKTSTYIICGQQTSLHESEYGVPTASVAISRTAVSLSYVCVVMSRITDSTRCHIIPSRTGITLIVEQCMLNMEQCMLNMEQCMLVAQANMLPFSKIFSRNAFLKLCFPYAPKGRLCQTKC